MLTIFVKYGKPLEDDEKTLIENKLIEKFEESQDVELKRERKIKAYNDLAELQVEAFIRTMRTYTKVKSQDYAYNRSTQNTPVHEEHDSSRLLE